MTIKGQVTIPKKVRDELGLKPGSRVEFVRGADGCYMLSPSEPDTDDDYLKAIDSVAGTLDLGMSTDEYMNILRGDEELP